MKKKNSSADLLALDATGAARQIAAGNLSSVTLVEACLDRIAKQDGEIGAWAYLDPEWALTQAKAADAARQAGTVMGPLHGVPLGIKDVIDTADMPASYGSPIFAGQRPKADAFCVSQLRAAGAVMLGKTVTTELASLTPSATRNPVAEGRTPGGSSAGTAAAVAAGMVPAGLGTQTAGSVIRPASFCGTYGFKPTLGLVSRSGVLMQSHTLDTIGVLARSLDDLALITDVMAAFDPTDSVSVQGSRPRLASSLAQLQAGGVHVGVVKTPAWDLVDEATRKAFDGLVAKLGAAAETLDVPGLDEVIEDQRIVQLAENVPYYGPLLDQHEALLSPLMKQRLRTGIAIPVRQYLECLLRREPAAARLSAAFAPGRVLMTLSAPGPAPRGLETTGNPIFNGLWTFLGVPALTLPLLTVDGAPVGVQLIGDRGQDAMLLAAARWLEIYLSKT